MIQRCTSCKRAFYYPRVMCPHCWSPEPEWIEVQGPARIISFTSVMRPIHRAFMAEVPVVLAEIALSEDCRMLARIVCSDVSQLEPGRAVALVSPEQAPGFPLPTFEPVASSQDRDKNTGVSSIERGKRVAE
jgi:uncharacterized OB-fold protein